jgi:putative addiction module antidote
MGVLYICITHLFLYGARIWKQAMKIEIKKIGNSDGLLLPRELMQRLDLKRGQQLHITELPGGGFQALPYDPEFERTMEIADELMDQYRDTLAALAK